MTDYTKLPALLPLIAVVATAISKASEKLTDEQTEANKAIKAGVSDSVREYTKATAAQGIAPKEAGDLLRSGLQVMGNKAGTALNYGRAVEGFAAIAAAGGDIDKASVKDAQDAMRSDETKAKDDVRLKIKPLLRDATLEQLTNLLAHAEAIGCVAKVRKVRADKAGPVVEVQPAAQAAG